MRLRRAAFAASAFSSRGWATRTYIMESQSIILGTINGISKKDFDILKKDLQNNFDKVAWKDDAIFIKSERKHLRMKSIFTRISKFISQGKYGSLLYVGNEKVACIYLGHKKYEGRMFMEPKPPEWWDSNQRNK